MTTSSSIHSNAFNFLSFVETGVDPRTGQYTCSLSLPELQANDLCGPNLPLRLSYSPLNTVNSGFGKGWSLQLSQYHTRDHIISLSTGETFKVTSTTSDGSGRQLMREQKIVSFLLFKLSETRLRVVHKSGLIEELDTGGSGSLALPVLQYSAQGHRIELKYRAFLGQRQLESVHSANGTRLLDISDAGGNLNIKVHPGTGHEALFKLEFNGTDRRLVRVVLPTANGVSSWRFGYGMRNDLLCVERVEGPLGGYEQITYDASPHSFPGTELRKLPRVRSHLHHPGVRSDQPPIETRYEYSDKNFLGFGAPGLSWDDSGEDNLYKINASYFYISIEQLWDSVNDKARRTITRTFNRFHLITEELTEQGDAVKRVRTRYYADEQDVPFEQQPPQCQLPMTVTTDYYRKSAETPRHTEVVSTEYDVFGNLTLQVQANGISEASTYYPAAGGDGCPADPHGFVRNIKAKTVTPGPDDMRLAPTLRTDYRYTYQPGLTGSAWPWLALESETLVHVNDKDAELQKTVHSYLDAPDDALRHGRKSQTAVTLNGQTTFTDYRYEKGDGTHSSQQVLRTTETLSTDFDEVSKTIILEDSLLHGHALLERDDNDVEIAYTYDQLGRVTQEMVAPGTDFTATRRYEYWLVDSAGAQARQIAIDVKEVRTVSLLDGLERVVSEERQDVDTDPVGKPSRLTYSARYDIFGQLVESTEFDWLGKESLPLTSTYTYDDWGEQDSVTRPDGVTEHTLNDPVAQQVTTWQDGMGKTVTQNNLFDKPDTVERLDLAGKRVSLYQYFYDGLGRTSHEYDELQQFRFYRYDAFGRMILSGLPDGAEVERCYASHSTEDLPTWIGVNGVVLGEQYFDGLERLYRSVTGGRERSFTFLNGRKQPSSVTTPSGQVVEYDYNLALGDEPVQRRILDGATADYSYDPRNARLLYSNENDQSFDRTYFSTGKLKTEKRTNAGQIYDMSYEYSLRGRLLAYTDVFGQRQEYGYDSGGRLKYTSLGQTETEFTYNASGQVSCIDTQDLAEGHRVLIGIEYDDFGRETLRTFTFDQGTAQTLEQQYNARDALVQRTLREGITLLRDETFGYDARGRLDDYGCSGTELPLDPYGKAIEQQVFTFDPLDNLTEVRTVFAGGENVATYLFEHEDPTQLSSVSNSHPDYPALIALEYDLDGNLIRDDQGRALQYDALGRLLSVSEGGNETLAYRYDAQDILSGSVGEAGNEQRFYCDGQLASQLHDEEQRSFIRGGEHVLAERVAGQGELLLATDAKKTVLAERDDFTRRSAYSAHGYRSSSMWTKGALGFDGEYLESSGVYLLGSYRAYSPVLMLFCTPDSWSPFGDGGLNGYAYCLGDPVNFVDPTGHLPKWLMPVAGLAMAAAGVAATVLSAGAATPALAGTAVAWMQGVSSVTAFATLGSSALSISAQLVDPESGIGEITGYVSMGLGAISFLSGMGAWALSAKAARAAKSASWQKNATDPRLKYLRDNRITKAPDEFDRIPDTTSYRPARELGRKDLPGYTAQGTSHPPGVNSGLKIKAVSSNPGKAGDRAVSSVEYRVGSNPPGLSNKPYAIRSGIF